MKIFYQKIENVIVGHGGMEEIKIAIKEADIPRNIKQKDGSEGLDLTDYFVIMDDQRSDFVKAMTAFYLKKNQIFLKIN